MPTPPTQKALIIAAPRTAHLTTTRPIPTLRPAYLLIKPTFLALNPTDWKHIDYMPTPNALTGCDYSGTIAAIGPAVTKPFAIGDRVCGACHGANRLELEDGAFAEWIVAKGDIQMRVPEGMGMEEAATLGVGVITVGQGLYQSLRLPLPVGAAQEAEGEGEGAVPVLVYGGSTATGTLAIQFAKLSGLTVITTCSPRNFPLVKRLGADAVFDYNDPNCALKIRTHTSNNLLHAFDCISEGSSINICAESLSTSTSSGTKRYSSLLGVSNFPRTDVETKTTIAYSAMGEDLSFAGQGAVLPPTIPANLEEARFMEMFIGIVDGLLAEGKIKPHPPSVRGGGLRGILDGWQDMRGGKVSGEKLVYRVADTL